MKALSRGTGIAISLVSGFLVLALLAELYYLLCLKKKKSTSSSSKRRRRRRILHHQQEREEEEKEEEEEEIGSSPAKELLYLFCWKKPSSLSSSEMYCSRSRVDNNVSERSEDEQLGIDAELMRLHSLSGPPRFLFTIKEETKEDLQESEDGRSRKNSISRGGRSLSDLLATTTETPMSSPPFFNPLFDSFKNDNEHSRMRSSSSSSTTSLSSPPPKFKFLRDAEEKLYRKILTEEALRVHRSSGGGSPAASPPPMTTRGPEDHEDGPFITIIISKTQQQQHPTPSQVNPLPSSPPSITITSTRTAAEQGKHVT